MGPVTGPAPMHGRSEGVNRRIRLGIRVEI